MRNVVASTVILALFALVGTGLVAFTQKTTAPRIAENERQALLRSLHAIIPPERYDNDIFADTTEVVSPQLLGTAKPLTVYRARKQGQPVAAAFAPVAPDGYSGAIRILVGIYYDGTVAGVRVVSQNETPGLGDAIEADRSDWIFGFTGKALGNPPEKDWAVKRDGGVFDQFTGATISPRAVVKAVRRSLIYFRSHRDEIFAPARAASSNEVSAAQTKP